MQEEKFDQDERLERMKRKLKLMRDARSREMPSQDAVARTVKEVQEGIAAIERFLCHDFSFAMLAYDDLETLIQKESVDDDKLYKLVHEARDQAATLFRQAHYVSCLALSAELKYRILDLFKDRPDFDRNIGRKQDIVKELNDIARMNVALFLNPSPKADSIDLGNILVVNTSRDGEGRYSFESKETRKRAGSYRTLTELLPFSFVINDNRSAFFNVDKSAQMAVNVRHIRHQLSINPITNDVERASVEDGDKRKVWLPQPDE